MKFTARFLACVVIGIANLAGCKDNGSVTASSGTPRNIQSTINRAVIQGVPDSYAAVGLAYSFQPLTNIPGNVGLVFSISNKPSWAAFDSATGNLHGSPTEADIGVYGPIVLSLSNGVTTSALSPFTITVTPYPQTAVSISWTKAEQETSVAGDTDVAGYHIYYGKNEANLNQIMDVVGGDSTNCILENLSSGTWYFAVAAYDSSAIESKLSGVISATI